MIDILQLPGWRVSGLGQDENCLVIEATYTTPDEACHKCGSIGALYKHGTKVVRFRDIPVRMMPTVIDGTVQRYRCRDCGETFVQTPEGIDDTRRMTERCVEFIKQQCIPHTFTHIAELVGCVEGTVRAIAAERFDGLRSERNYGYNGRMPKHPDSLIIDRIGGNAVIAPIFGITSQYITKWRRTGIPRAYRMYLAEKYPAEFDGSAAAPESHTASDCHQKAA